jgi:hypothetical protein
MGGVMPVWLEILIDVLGFAGFLVIANYRRSPRSKNKPVHR